MSFRSIKNHAVPRWKRILAGSIFTGKLLFSLNFCFPTGFVIDPFLLYCFTLLTFFVSGKEVSKGKDKKRLISFVKSYRYWVLSVLDKQGNPKVQNFIFYCKKGFVFILNYLFLSFQPSNVCRLWQNSKYWIFL